MVRPFSTRGFANDKAQGRQAHQPGKGKRNKFNLSPFPLAPFPFPMPNAPCPIPFIQPNALGQILQLFWLIKLQISPG